MYALYSFLAAIALLLLSPYFLFVGLRRGKYLHNIRERLGHLPDEACAPPGTSGAIWIHAVSVGEAIAAIPLARRLKERFPGHRLVISTTTATGQKLVRERMEFADAFFYFPFDFAFCVRRVLRAIRPALIVVLETEIWPNFLREAARALVPVVFANGRVSDRSFHRYRWWNRLSGGFLRRALRSPARFLMQTDEDASRLISLGAPPERVSIAGNLKYDLAPARSAPLADWLESQARSANRSPVIVAGSVTAGEEPLVLIAFGVVQGQWPRALLVLAPRKPERFDAAATHIEESQREFLRRRDVTLNGTGGPRLPESASVFLLDSVGELASLYRLADAVFVGGSLVPDGGHNILEPAASGKPPLFGPSMENFREMAATFLEAQAALLVRSPEDLGVAWIELIQDSARRERMGRIARELVERNRGATERALDAVSSALEASPRSRA